MIYLDNNATTIMPMPVKKAMIEWCNRGNPSAGYASAKEARLLMEKLRKDIGQLCNFNPCCAEPRDETYNMDVERVNFNLYKIIFTSGASESNCMLVSSVIDSYKMVTGEIPHVVISAIEHKSLIMLVESYEQRGLITATLVQPVLSGHITPASIEKAIQPNTCIVICMHANNETGAINDVRRIGKISHKHNIPYHCDTVQSFGKYPVQPLRDNIDSFCISFHKLHGPPGIGALIVKQKLLIGYKLQPIVYGTQNEGFRGGTENLPGIGASATAIQTVYTRRAAKNQHMLRLKKTLMGELNRRIPTCKYVNYFKPRDKVPEVEIVFLSGITKDYLPNTCLLSVVKRSKPYICNGKIRDALQKKGIVVSVGSACNTSNANASHVLYALNADDFIKRGAIRISIGDENTEEEIQTFVREFLVIIKNQC